MSKQIAVRLPDELVDFVDEVVHAGAQPEPSRSRHTGSRARAAAHRRRARRRDPCGRRSGLPRARRTGRARDQPARRSRLMRPIHVASLDEATARPDPYPRARSPPSGGAHGRADHHDDPGGFRPRCPLMRPMGSTGHSVVSCDNITTSPKQAFGAQIGVPLDPQELALHDAIWAAFDLDSIHTPSRNSMGCRARRRDRVAVGSDTAELGFFPRRNPAKHARANSATVTRAVAGRPAARRLLAGLAFALARGAHAMRRDPDDSLAGRHRAPAQGGVRRAGSPRSPTLDHRSSSRAQRTASEGVRAPLGLDLAAAANPSRSPHLPQPGRVWPLCVSAPITIMSPTIPSISWDQREADLRRTTVTGGRMPRSY